MIPNGSSNFMTPASRKTWEMSEAYSNCDHSVTSKPRAWSKKPADPAVPAVPAAVPPVPEHPYVRPTLATWWMFAGSSTKKHKKLQPGELPIPRTILGACHGENTLLVRLRSTNQSNLTVCVDHVMDFTLHTRKKPRFDTPSNHVLRLVLYQPFPHRLKNQLNACYLLQIASCRNLLRVQGLHKWHCRQPQDRTFTCRQ
jgi:hypothetical protein